MSIPSERTIKRNLRKLRQLIDESKDPIETRIAYAIECAMTWAREDTTWEADYLVREAKDEASCLHKELNEQ